MDAGKTIYMDACPLIDAAKFKARFHGAQITIAEEREKDVWYVDKILEMARNGIVKIITSTVTIAECTHTQDSANPVPTAEIKRFYSELLSSGKSGISLVQPLQAILIRARKLRWEDSIFLAPIDSIHVATALHCNCVEIWTRDGKILTSFADRLANLGLNCVGPSETKMIAKKDAPKNPPKDDPNQGKLL